MGGWKLTNYPVRLLVDLTWRIRKVKPVFVSGQSCMASLQLAIVEENFQHSLFKIQGALPTQVTPAKQSMTRVFLSSHYYDHSCFLIPYMKNCEAHEVGKDKFP